MADIYNWLEGHEGQPNPVIPDQYNLIYLLEGFTNVGPSATIIHIPQQHRRFQAIKTGETGSSTVVIDVSDDPKVKTDQSNAAWIPLATITLDASNNTVNFEGLDVPLIGKLTCGFSSHDGWKFVTARVVAHTGDPVSLIMGV